MSDTTAKKKRGLTAPPTGNESNSALKARADKLQTKAADAARRESKRRSKALTPPDAGGQSGAGDTSPASSDQEDKGGLFGTGLTYNPRESDPDVTGDYHPGGGSIGFTGKGQEELTRQTPGAELPEQYPGTPQGVGAAMGNAAGKTLTAPMLPLGAAADPVGQFGKGMVTGDPGDGEQGADSTPGESQPDQSPKGPGQKSVGVEERSFNRGGSYFVNEDGPGGNPVYSGTEEGATDPQFHGGGLSVMGGGRSSRGLTAPPARSVELDQAEQALAQGDMDRARSLLQSPEEAQAGADQQETSRLRRQANQQPNLSMPFGQMLQTTAERNAAQEQLQARAQAEADKKAARTQAAQSERESQRDFAARMAQAQAENQPEPREWEFEKIQQMTEKGPEESLVAMDPRTGRATSVNPTTPPNSEDLQGLREAAQQGGDAARKAAQAFEKKHGGLPKWYVRFRQQATGGNQTANS